MPSKPIPPELAPPDAPTLRQPFEPSGELEPSPAPPVVPAAPEGPAEGPRAAVEGWAARHKVSLFDLVGTRATRLWGIGHQVTEAEFLDAVAAFRGMEMG